MKEQKLTLEILVLPQSHKKKKELINIQTVMPCEKIKP